MSNETKNTYETTARAAKVDQMVGAIDRAAIKRGFDIYEDAGKILASLEKYTEENWKTVDKVAMLKSKSSDLTRKMVKEIYRKRIEDAPF